MLDLTSALAVALLAGPAAALAALAAPSPDAACRRAARAVALGAALAAVLLASAVLGDGATVGPFAATSFSALVLVLVLGMGATVLSFAGRALRHEPYQQRFAVVGGAVVGAAASFACATDVLVLVAGWLVSSALTVALLRTGPDAGRTARAQRVRRTFLIGDACVVVGTGVLAWRAGSTTIADLDVAGPWAAAAGVLLVVGAAARAATAPFHRWLPSSIVVPTPTSALLHAGVVNGGAILLITLAPAVAEELVPALLAVALGATSCAFAEAVMLTRPDVKGRLAWSTVAQMSFTLVLCGLGLHVAAALHLVAHGMYKGALFLGSGSSVRAAARDRAVAAPGWPRAQRAPVALAMPLLAGAGALVALGEPATAELLVPVGLVAVAGARASQGWASRSGSRRHAVTGIVVASGLVAAFVATTSALKGPVQQALVPSDPAVPALAVLAVLGPLGAIAWAHGRPGIEVLAPVWARARRAGQAALSSGPRATTRPADVRPSTTAIAAAPIGG